jgi:hypothetical protein
MLPVVIINVLIALFAVPGLIESDSYLFTLIFGAIATTVILIPSFAVVLIRYIKNGKCKVASDLSFMISVFLLLIPYLLLIIFQ